VGQKSTVAETPIATWQRDLLVVTAIFTVLLVGMGGILCMTQNIRACPDWPGCFGRVIPPPETGPILEYTHRVLAALTGLLVLASAITGLVRTRRLYWISLPPLVAVMLVVEVSYFGAVIVLRGLSAGWSAVDMGSALLVVALMVAAAVIASIGYNNPHLHSRLAYHSPSSRLVLVTAIIVYAVLVSGVLVAGTDPLVGCLGWPIYGPALQQAGSLSPWQAARLALSVVGAGMIVGVMVQAWHSRGEKPEVYRFALRVGIAFLVEALLQVLILAFRTPTILLVAYTITAAAFWGLLVALLVRSGWVEQPS